MLTTETNPLFRDRVPEAAALQLAIVLASSTEYHLATLESLEMRKSTSKSDLARQRAICDTLVQQCRDLGMPAEQRGLRGLPCGRLRERLEVVPSSGQALAASGVPATAA